MKETESQCPSPEELLEFSEGKANPVVSRHLESCQKCRKFVEGNQMLNQLLEDYSKPSPDFAERIQAACREQRLEDEFLTPSQPVSRKTPRLVFYQRVLRVAALFVLLLGVFALLRTEKKSSPSLDVAARSAEAPAVAAAPEALLTAVQQPPLPLPETTALPAAVASAADGFSWKDNMALGKMSKSRLPQDIMTVSTQGGSLKAVPQNGLSKISDEVTHIWVTDTLPKKNALELPEGCAVQGADTPDENGIVTWTVVAPDSAVQQLTDCLYQKHWRLVSPAAPQPNKKEFAAFNGHPVKYTLKIVTE